MMKKKTIKALRLECNMSQSDLAEAIEVSLNTLIKYEKGESFPHVPAIYKLEKVFGVQFQDIDFLC